MTQPLLSRPLLWIINGWVTMTPMIATETEAFAPLESYVQETMTLLHPSSAAIIVSRGDQVIYERYLSGSFEGLPPTPINAASLFPLASVTKSFTSGVLMALVHDKRVDLDVPVSQYLSAIAEPGNGPHSRATVTLRHLASHTSGLQYPEGERYGTIESVEAMTEPGQDFRYSETGMNVLQAVLEAATGEAWEALLQTLILDPLNLSSTRYISVPDPAVTLVPAKSGEFSDPADHYFFTAASSLTGSGLYATARDVNRYGQWWALQGAVGDVRLFSQENAAEATRTHAVFDYNGAHYGLLWWILPDRGAIIMSGANHTVSAIVPETQTVVTVMRNYFGEIPEGFVFHEDKMRLADFAVSIGESR